ncbi:hypothetical protein [Streptomyces cadmiisoli]|uniref:hypothetical protein n=1 Tax=Streptomyces cadmiisoli TaxID=2184053 RepID=UPI003D7288CA
MPELITLLAAAEEAGGGPDIGKLVLTFAQYGVVGLVVVLMMFGVLVPSYVMKLLTADRDAWRNAFEKERDAHEVTRQQLAAAQASAEVATEQGLAMVRMLEGLGHRPQTSQGSL